MRWTVAIVIIAMIGAAVALAVAGWEAGAIIGLLVAVSAMIAPMLAVIYKTDQHTTELQTISEQTNGTLDKRIKAAVAAGIEAHLVEAQTRTGPPDHGQRGRRPRL